MLIKDTPVNFVYELFTCDFFVEELGKADSYETMQHF